MVRHKEGGMTLKARGLHGCLQRVQELQARINTLSPQRKDEWVGTVGPNPRPMSGSFSEFLTGTVSPLNPMGEGFERTLNRAPADLLPLIQSAATKAGIDPALFEALVGRESSFKPDSVSIAGAKGLAQLMPRTAASLGVTDIFDPQQNLEAGARYLAQMLRDFDGDKELALAAYNAGPGTVRQVGAVPPESAGYVRDVLKRAAELGGTSD